jgi:hypothetical protein
MLNEQLVDAFGLSMLEAKTITGNIDLTQLVRAKPADMPKLLLTQMQKAGAAAIELVVDPMLHRMLNEQLADTFGLTKDDAVFITKNIDLTQLVRAKPADMPKVLLKQMQKAAAAAIDNVIDPALYRMLNEQLVDAFGLSMAEARKITKHTDLTQLVRAKPVDMPKLLLTQMQKAGGSVVETVVNPMLHRILTEKLVDVLGLSMGDAANTISSIDLTQLVRARPADIPKLLLSQVHKAATTALETVINPMLKRVLNEQLVDVFGLTMDDALKITSSVDLPELVRAPIGDLPKLLMQQTKAADSELIGTVIDPMLHRMLNDQLILLFGLSMPEVTLVTSKLDLTHLVQAQPADIPQLLLKQVQKSVKAAVPTIIDPMMKRMINEQLVDTFGVTMEDARNVTELFSVTELVSVSIADIPNVLLRQMTGAFEQVMTKVISPAVHQLMVEQLVDWFGVSVTDAQTVVDPVNLTLLMGTPLDQMPKVLIQQASKLGVQFVRLVLTPAVQDVLDGELMDRLGLTLEEAGKITQPLSDKLLEMATASPAELPALLLHMTKDIGLASLETLTPALKQLIDEELIDHLDLSMAEARNITEPIAVQLLLTAAPSDVPKALLDQAKAVGEQLIKNVVLPAVKRAVSEQLIDRFGLTYKNTVELFDLIGFQNLVAAPVAQMPAVLWRQIQGLASKETRARLVKMVMPVMQQMLAGLLMDKLGISNPDADKIVTALGVTVIKLVSASPVEIPAILAQEIKTKGGELVVILQPVLRRLLAQKLVDVVGIMPHQAERLAAKVDLQPFVNSFDNPAALPMILFEQMRDLATELADVVQPAARQVIQMQLEKRFDLQSSVAQKIAGAIDIVVLLKATTTAELLAALTSQLEAVASVIMGELLEPAMKEALAKALVKYLGMEQADAVELADDLPHVSPLVDRLREDPSAFPLTLWQALRPIREKSAYMIEKYAKHFFVEVLKGYGVEGMDTEGVEYAQKLVDIGVPEGGVLKLLDTNVADIPATLWQMLQPKLKELASVLAEVAGSMLRLQLIGGYDVIESDADLIVSLLPIGASLMQILSVPPAEMVMQLWDSIKSKLKEKADAFDRLAKKFIVKLLVARFRVDVDDATELVGLLPNLVELLTGPMSELPQKLIQYAKDAARRGAQKALEIASRILQALVRQELVDRFEIPDADAQQIATKVLDSTELVDMIGTFTDIASLPQKLFDMLKSKVAQMSEDKALLAILTRSINRVLASWFITVKVKGEHLGFKFESTFSLLNILNPPGDGSLLLGIVEMINDPGKLPTLLIAMCKQVGMRAMGALFQVAKDVGETLMRPLKERAVKQIKDILVNEPTNVQPEIAQELAEILMDIQEAFMHTMMDEVQKMKLTSALGGLVGAGEGGGKNLGDGGGLALGALTSSSGEGSAACTKGMDALVSSADSFLVQVDAAIVARRRVLGEGGAAAARPAADTDGGLRLSSGRLVDDVIRGAHDFMHSPGGDTVPAGSADGVALLESDKSVVEDVVQGSTEALAKAEELKKKVTKQLKSTLTTIIDVMNRTSSTVDGFIEKMSATVSRVLTDLKAKADGAVMMIESKVLEGVALLQTTVNTVLTKLRSVLGTIQTVATRGVNLLNNQVTEGINTVFGAVQELIATADAFATKLIGYVDEARKLLNLVNKYAHEGFTYATDLIDSVQGFAETVFDKIDKFVDNMFDKVNDAMEKADELIAGILMVLKLMKMFASLLGKIRSLHKKYGSAAGVLKYGLKEGAKYGAKYAAAEAKARATGQPNEMLHAQGSPSTTDTVSPLSGQVITSATS